MELSAAKLELKNYVESPDCQSDLDFYETLGVIAASLCHSDTEFDVNLLPIISGHPDSVLDEFSDVTVIPKPLIDAIKLIKDTYYSLFQQGQFTLFYECKQEPQAQAPNPELSAWCQGFILFCREVEEVWQDDFELMNAVDQSGEFINVQDEHEAFLDLMTTLANWQRALADNPGKHGLMVSKLNELIEVGSEAICNTFRLARIFENLKLEAMAEQIDEDLGEGWEDCFELDELSDAESLNQDLTDIEYSELGEASSELPFTRESPKIKRNDPCPCGSGKKYKKCCLN